MDLNDVFKRISSKGDIAAVTLGFVTGCILDVTVVPHGLPLTMAQAGALGSAAVLGIKNGIEAWAQQADERALRNQPLAGRPSPPLIGDVQNAGSQRDDLEAKCQAATQLIDTNDLFASDPVLKRQSQSFRSDADLWRQHLIDDSAMFESIESLIRIYRDTTKDRHVPDRLIGIQTDGSQRNLADD